MGDDIYYVKCKECHRTIKNMRITNPFMMKPTWMWTKIINGLPEAFGTHLSEDGKYLYQFYQGEPTYYRIAEWSRNEYLEDNSIIRVKDVAKQIMYLKTELRKNLNEIKYRRIKEKCNEE